MSKFTIPVVFAILTMSSSVCAEVGDSCVSRYDSIQGRQIYSQVEVEPEFPGGVQGLMRFLMDSMQAEFLPGPATGTVYISMLIEPDGRISRTQIRKGVNPYVDKEALRLIGLMPNWRPGRCNDIEVPVEYVIPLRINLH